MTGTSTDALQTLLGTSEMAGWVRNFDWSRTTMGAIADWPPHIRAAVSIALRAPTPMVLLFGDDGVMIYNDGYIPIAGKRHPGCLGVPVREGWPEIADFNGNVLRVVLAGGTLSYEDQELTVRRNGVDERIWISVDYSPIPDAAGAPRGVFVTVRETTENVRLRRVSVSERERMARMFEQAPGFMAMLSGPDHVFEFVNPAYRKLIGHRDVIGKTVREALPDLEGQGFFEPLDTVYRSGEPFIGQGVPAALQPAPGAPMTERMLDFVYQPLRDPDDAIIGIFVEGADITERIAAERAMRESELRFRVFADALPNHLWSALPDGSMDWYNDRLRRYFDLPSDGFVIPERWVEMIHADDRPEVIERWKTAIRAGSAYEAEARLVRADGAWRWHLLRALPLRDEAGVITRWIGTNTDVDDSRRAVAALRDSETRLRLSQAVAGIASLEVDIASGEVIGSEGFWSLWGLEPRASVSAEVLEGLILPEDALARSTRTSRLDGSAERQVEYRVRRADTGEIRWVARHIEFVHDAEGRPVKMFGVIRDITEAKDAEARQRLLAHELSHRIKNILATVLAIVSQTLKTTDIATARTLLTQRLQALGAAHDLLNLTRWTTAPIGQVVEGALTPFPGNRISIEGPEIAIGPRRALSLTLAVNELATNALKYGALAGDGPGEVRIGWRRETDAEGAALLVWTWEEIGGPPVSPPARRGFGRMLLERVLSQDFAGKVSIEFAPSGVAFKLEAPWASLSECQDKLA